MTCATHGSTEISLALGYLLGYDFMARMRELKDQQRSRIDRPSNAGGFTPVLPNTADLDMVEEQGDAREWFDVGAGPSRPLLLQGDRTRGRLICNTTRLGASPVEHSLLTQVLAFRRRWR